MLVKEKTHGFSFWTATLVLPRLPKKHVLDLKKTWLFGGLNSCVFMLENTRVLFLHKTHECGVDKPFFNTSIFRLFQATLLYHQLYYK